MRRSKEERARLERLSGKLTKHEAAEKRASARLTRAFNAWARSRAQLARTIKAIERPPEEPKVAHVVEPELNDSLTNL